MKLQIATLLLLLSIPVCAQNLSGKAYYESKTTVDMSEFGGREMSEDMKKQILARMKNYLEKTYILSFNGSESMYSEDEKLEAGGSNQGFGMMMNSFLPGDLYKNLATGELIEEREFFGKQFLVKDSIPTLAWEVTKDSKQIGQYLAIRATAIKKIDPNDVSMMRRRRDRDNDEKKESEAKTDTTKVEDPFEALEVPKEVVVTAWFTPMIPVQNGPGEFTGLPGLILELNVDRTTLLCSKIVLNPKEAAEINPPKKGSEVSREEYNKIVSDKTEEMRQNFRNRGGRGGGGRGRMGG